MGLLAFAPALRAEGYRLQVASVEETLFHRYVNTQGQPFQTAQHILPRLEEALDQGTLPPGVLLADREPRLLSAVSTVPGQAEPKIVAGTAPLSPQPWNTVAWEGTAGQTVVFRISSNLVHYQELMEIAVNTDGVLRRLPVFGIPMFGAKQLLVPALSDTFIATQVERRTFVAWAAQHAVSQDGLSVVVGRNHDQKFPDAVYILVRTPPAAKTYKLVMAWRDREALRGGTDRGGDFNN
jgi:hypothetical protein